MIGSNKKQQCPSGMRLWRDIREARKVSETLKKQDPRIWNHCFRVTALVTLMIPILDYRPSQIKGITEAASFHDIGMLAISAKIRNKGPLPATAELLPHEYEVYKQHTVKGYEYIKQNKYLRHTLPAILYHHKKWDGSGYPEGLKGAEIPLTARIISVADELDAMVNPGAGGTSYAMEWALNSIRLRAGKDFDPHIVKALLKIGKQDIREVLNLFLRVRE